MTIETATVDTAQHADFCLEEFFSGPMSAWGMFQDRFGRVRQQFSVQVRGDWCPKSRELKISEDFVYAGGTRDRRIWHITKIAEDRYQGKTGDIVGAARIRILGSSANLRYRLRLPVGARHLTFDFDDWMYRQGDDVVLNRATVRKWGVVLGSTTICFLRGQDQQPHVHVSHAVSPDPVGVPLNGTRLGSVGLGSGYAG